MTEIDYRVLSKDLASAYIGPRLPGVPFEGWWERDAPKEAWERVARAVVAALRDQGLVVVRADDVRLQMVHFYGPELEYPWVSDQRTFPLAQSFERICAALAAPGGGETT